ncbi:MAG: ATP-binding cassette domain-containing protein [Desulfobacterales bacterium]
MTCCRTEMIDSLPLIVFKDIAVRLGERLILPHTDWEIRSDQHWAVLGPNGAGKSSLVRALAGDLPIVRGTVRRYYSESEKPAYVSFELQRRLIAKEEEQDHARYFSGNPDSLTTARQIIAPFDSQSSGIENIALQLKIQHLLDRGIRFLSTGQMRKVLIARALIRSPRLLILDEPFDGLDAENRKDLTRIIRSLMKDSTQVILVTHREEEILPEISHVLYVENCRVIRQGPRSEMPAKPFSSQREKTSFSPPVFSESQRSSKTDVPVIEMKNVTVRYGDTVVFRNLDWMVREGENWAVLGPNGAGKTTLLRLISGDHPQAYANEIRLFGKLRGSGESIWEIKEHIGIVSSEFQIHYRKSVTALDAVISGFFDSVGLYRKSASWQRKTALQWIYYLGMGHKAEQRFDRLSGGEQRMILLARSLVKSPDLLILDEPCQGLDTANRQRILNLIDHIGHHSDTQILYVSHHPEEMPSCIRRILDLKDFR